MSPPSSSMASATQGYMRSSPPPYSADGIATGTIPSASTASVLPKPHVATRSGTVSIVVSPYMCCTVTGKLSAPAEAAAESSVGSLLPQLASAMVVDAIAASTTAARIVARSFMGPCSFGRSKCLNRCIG